MKILEILNLSVENGEKKILGNLNLLIKKNETHIIMGPNGSGKSTLAKVLAGHPNYKVSDGNILFLGNKLELLATEDRAKRGLFLAFQSPVEINGLTCFDFFHLILNEHLNYKGEKPLSPIQFFPIIKELFHKLKIKEELLNRNFNEGFSGGEKKKNEILQLLLLEPKLAILDEIDSGLDLDALKCVCDILKKKKKTSFLVITHSPKVVELLKPDFVHIFCEGKIRKTGNDSLVSELDKKGYDFFLQG